MSEPERNETPRMLPAPRGIALLLALGPGLMWCGEYIGSGEVILATRSGAIFGVAILWVPVLAIFLKFWIGLAGAHYTVTTGEGMIDMMARTPGPKNWVIWPVFLGQVSSGAISTGALASVAGVFASYFIPLPSYVLGWIAVLLVIALVWSGLFEPLKRVMAVLVLVIIVGTFAVALETLPAFRELLHGLFGFSLPQKPGWALTAEGQSVSPWSEILPLLGWAAGGFASQVWYTYWVLGAGYGMAHGRGYGQPLDAHRLSTLSMEEAEEIHRWRRVVTLDALVALLIGIAVTAAFVIAGNGVLRPMEVAPDGASVAMELSHIFSQRWGAWGAHLFVLAGLAAMLSTMLGQFAGWPRLIADCGRILFPPVARWPWKRQFRSVLLFFAVTNMLIVYTLGLKPVFLVQTSAILDGLVLTPLQALAVGLTLFVVMPRLFPQALRPRLRAHPIFAVALLAAFVAFTYCCIFELGGMMLGRE